MNKSGSHAFRPCGSQRGNELTTVIPGFIFVIPGFILVIPGFILVISGFILVIPAKAGIHTDSPPEPYCPVSPWPCHPPRRQRSTIGAGFPPSRE
ncbi:hypothetical protein [Endozoicomonas sp. ALB032]|uniref:hypothetical protein n=1 Tax=Endozoicomonas sp. ALB032 TaxID=3403082 RepID=UPI003BB746A3